MCASFEHPEYQNSGRCYCGEKSFQNDESSLELDGDDDGSGIDPESR
jgi:hypothetical protein